MTSSALRIEISTAGIGVPDQHVQHYRRTGRRSALSLTQGEDAMDVLGDRTDVIGGKIVRRHGWQSRILASFANNRLKQLAGLIVQCDLGAQKIGAALLATAQVGAVA